MSLTTACSYKSINVFNNSATPFSMPVQDTIENVSSYRSVFQTEREISEKTEHFIQVLHQRVSSEGRELDLSPLHAIFNRMAQAQDQTIKQALDKPSGYLSRLFSNESWEEWLETKTSLGKVVDIFASYVKNAPRDRDRLLTRYLDADTLQRANAQAEALLEQLAHADEQNDKSNLDCSAGLVLGAAGSLATQNILPMGVASLNCLSGTTAQRGANAHRQQILNGMNKIRENAGIKTSANTVATNRGTGPVDNRVEQLRMQLFEDLHTWSWDYIERNYETKADVVNHIIAQLGVALDLLCITAPINNFKHGLWTWDIQYWTYVVQPEYLDIFPMPQNLGYTDFDRASYKVSDMKAKLKQHGYDPLNHGTPLRYIKYLKSRKVCEIGNCHF